MRLAVSVCAFVTLCCGGMVVEAQPTPSTSAPVQEQPEASPLKPWVTRHTTFNIPFTVDVSRGLPREVQLFVSQDGGTTWHFYGRQAPTAEVFHFRAAGDGNFWFASRTIDPQHNLPPIEQLRPKLHVQVDTQLPRLEFNAVVGTAGEVATSWNVTDASLDPNSLKIEYQVTPGLTWRPISIDRSRSQVTSETLAGEMTWWPEGESRLITVRAEVADQAGNKSVVHRQITLPPVVARKPPITPDATQPLTPVSQVNTVPRPTASEPRFEPSRGATPWPADNQLRAERAPVAEVPTSKIPASDVPVNSESTQPITTMVAAEAGQVDNPYYSRSGLPAGERPRMTNAFHFQLDYELDAVGPDGVDEVQLWGSTDFGQTWTRWSLDDDLGSPLDVQVDREGIFGFRVVIVGRNGLATPAPRPGDLADVWVGVDITKPVARISSAIYGQGLHAGELDIRWEVNDESLGDRPVTLQFSEQANGPWTTIAAGLPNTKQYYWSVDPNMPKQIYLRLEVRDEAGNLTVHQLVDPISTMGLIPKAFIRSVRPVATPPHEAQRVRNRYAR